MYPILRYEFLRDNNLFERISIKKKTESTFRSQNLLGVILAPNERWNRAWHMRVERLLAVANGWVIR